ncbi:MAG: ASCH domain-containing protein [Dermatophilaceae bacterium]
METPIAVLTVQQPWAWAIAQGTKRVENRGRRTMHRGMLAIHAGQRTDPSARRFMADRHVIPPSDLPSGVILGFVRVLDCVQDSADPWAMPGYWHWVLGVFVPLLVPVPCRGQLGIFRAPAVVAEQLRDSAG